MKDRPKRKKSAADRKNDLRLSLEVDKQVSNCLDSLPVDIEGVARAWGITVKYRDDLSDDIVGSLLPDKSWEGPDTRYIIEVNARHHLYRRRYTIAHELGIWRAYPKQIGDGITHDRQYRSTLGRKYEKFSCFWAGLYLLPDSWIRILIGSDHTTRWVARKLEVSERALRIRMKGIWTLDRDTPEGWWERFWIPKPEYYEDQKGHEAVYGPDDDLEDELDYDGYRPLDSLLEEIETWVDYLSPEDKQEYFDAVKAQQKKG